MHKASDITFWVFVAVYLTIRDWPFGDLLQTVADILLLIAAGFTIANHFVKEKSEVKEKASNRSRMVSTLSRI